MLVLSMSMRLPLLYIKQITNKDLLNSARNHGQYFIIIYKGKEFEKIIHIYVYLNHFAVHSKLTQLCKSTVLCSVVSVVSNSLQPQGLLPIRLLCPWNFSGKNTGVGCHFLTYMQSASCEMLSWMKHKLESRLPGEILITSNMLMILS